GDTTIVKPPSATLDVHAREPVVFTETHAKASSLELSYPAPSNMRCADTEPAILATSTTNKQDLNNKTFALLIYILSRIIKIQFVMKVKNYSTKKPCSQGFEGQ